eukprot:3680252-Prymnesium_polylepis.1
MAQAALAERIVCVSRLESSSRLTAELEEHRLLTLRDRPVSLPNGKGRRSIQRRHGLTNSRG